MFIMLKKLLSEGAMKNGKKCPLENIPSATPTGLNNGNENGNTSEMVMKLHVNLECDTLGGNNTKYDITPKLE